MSDRSAANRRLVVIVLVAVGVAVALGVGLFFAGGDDPAPVDSSAAAEQADAAASETEQDATASEGEEDGATDDEGAAAPAADGTWTVDTDVVPYVFADGTGTFVGFRIDEELSSVGETEAVGRTPAVEGQLVLDGTTITEAGFTGDARALTTDRSQRDDRARAALGDGVLRFELTTPIELDAVPGPGESVTADAEGDLTINGVTQARTIPLEATLSQSGVLTITSSFDVLLSDHDVTAPQAGPVLSISDTATVEVQLFMTEG